MPPRLIVNADDFGLTEGINRAVGELYRAGALSSATLMANGPAFDDAVRVARENPGLAVGCHVVLTDGIPVSHPADIPTLLGPDEKTFRESLVDFGWAVVCKRVRQRDIAREAYAQISKLQRAGIDVTHIDTHKHTHMLPGVARPLLFVAERARVGAVRNPFEQRWSLRLARGSWIRRAEVKLLAPLRRKFLQLPQIRSGVVATTDGTIGVSATGRLDRAALDALLAAVPEGVWELVTHPGYDDRDLGRVKTRLRATRDVERLALLDAIPAAAAERVELTQYGTLGPFARVRALRQFEPNTGHERFV